MILETWSVAEASGRDPEGIPGTCTLGMSPGSMSFIQNLKGRNTMSMPLRPNEKRELAPRSILKAGLRAVLKSDPTISQNKTLSLACMWPWPDPSPSSQCTDALWRPGQCQIN